MNEPSYSDSDPAGLTPLPAASGVDGENDEIDLKKTIRRFVIATIGIVVVVGGLAILFRDELTAVGKVFVENFGGWGIVLGYVLPDGLAVPLPNVAFSFFGFHGGMGYWEVVAWSTVGTLIGGSVGWSVGRLLQKTRGFQKIMQKRGREVHLLFKRYGTIALIIAAITPIPYSIACWAAGAAGMSFLRFFLISLTRFIYVVMYVWLITEGIVEFT